jgi:AcrR family transcriptional regulator
MPESGIGSMYKYFNNKADLYLTVVHMGVEALKAALDEIITVKRTCLPGSK